MSKLQSALARYHSQGQDQVSQLSPTTQDNKQEQLTESLPTLPTLLDSGSSGGQSSPLQKMVLGWAGQARINKLPPFVFKLLPKDWAAKLQMAIAMMDDPEQLHYMVHSMVSSLQKGLNDDHTAGIGQDDFCERASTSEIGKESSESLSSGSDGRGEVDTDGSVDGRIPSSLLVTEAASKDANL